MSIDVSGVTSTEMRTAGSTRWSDEKRDNFGHFFGRSNICLANLDPAVRVVDANTEFFRQFGPTSDICGRDFSELLHPSVRDTFAQQFASLASGERRRFTERMVGLRSGGSVFGGELSAIGVCNEAGKVQGITAMVRPDKTERNSHLLVGRQKLLSNMEARILEGVAAGVSTVQLAALLYLSRGGVEYHVTTLLRRMKVRNRPALVSKAYSMGIFAMGSWPPRVLTDYLK